MSTILPHMIDLSANLECMSEMCCMRLAGNTGCINSPYGHYHTTLSGYIFTTKHISTIGKKLVKQQYLPHLSLQYGELRPTSGWDRFVSLGHPCKFQRLSRLGCVTARYSSSGRQPNFAVLNRGCHLYLTGRPSRWASAHILVLHVFSKMLLLSKWNVFWNLLLLLLLFFIVIDLAARI